MTERLPTFGESPYYNILVPWLRFSHNADGSLKAFGSNLSGAVVNGFTDVAIQAAIDTVSTAGGGYVIVPPGSYTKAGATWTTLLMKPHVHMLGSLGMRGQWSGQSGKGSAFVNNDAVDTLTYTTVGGLLGNASAIGGIAFESTSSSGVHIAVPAGANDFAIRNVSLSKKATSVKFTGGVYTFELDNVRSYDAQSHAIWGAASGGAAVGPVAVFRNVYVAAAVGDGIRFDGGVPTLGVTLINPIVAGPGANTAIGINFVDAARGFQIIGLDVEAYNLIAAQTGLVLRGTGLLLGGAVSANGIGIKFIGATGITMGGVRFGSMTGNDLEIDATSTNNTILPCDNLANISDLGSKTLWLHNGKIAATAGGLLRLTAGVGLDLNGNAVFADGLVGRGAGSGWSAYVDEAELIRVNDDKSLEYRTAPVAPAAASIAVVPTITLKTGSAAGDYSTTSATYADVDATNLAYTVTIPTGMKLVVTATAVVQNSGAASTAMGFAIHDGAVVAENVTEALVAAHRRMEVITHVIVGDGASHTVKLQWKCSAGTSTMTNSSTTFRPRMTFILSPSL